MQIYEFTRILADRDVVPEPSKDTLKIDSNGNGVTNVIQRYINIHGMDSDLIEHVLLNELHPVLFTIHSQ